MCFELRSISDFLDSVSIRDCVLIWLNGNEASTHGVNKGNCKDSASRLLLSSILGRCDTLRLQILAIWIPREQNQSADFLSDLSIYLNRSHVYGTMVVEPPATGGKGSPEIQQQAYDDKQYVRHTNGYGGRAYPPSYESLAIFLFNLVRPLTIVPTSYCKSFIISV